MLGAGLLGGLIQAGEVQSRDVGRVTGTNPDAARIIVHEVTTAISGLREGRDAEHAHDS